MFALRALANRLEAGDRAGSAYPLGLLIAVAIDCIIDGVVVGAGFAAGARQGLLISVSLTLEVLFLGLATAAMIKGGGGSSGGVLAVCAGLAIVLVGSTYAGLLLLSGRPPWVLTGFWRSVQQHFSIS
jgi:ZIP family zinc transporter